VQIATQTPLPIISLQIGGILIFYAEIDEFPLQKFTTYDGYYKKTTSTILSNFFLPLEAGI